MSNWLEPWNYWAYPTEMRPPLLNFEKVNRNLIFYFTGTIPEPGPISEQIERDYLAFEHTHRCPIEHWEYSLRLPRLTAALITLVNFHIELHADGRIQHPDYTLANLERFQRQLNLRTYFERWHVLVYQFARERDGIRLWCLANEYFEILQQIRALYEW